METSSSSSVAGRPDGEKPVVVRVKRNSHHSRLDAFWLEINERPWKRQMLELEKLSINDNSRVEELEPRKVLVKHVETVTGSKDAIDVVQSVVMPKSTEVDESAARTEGRRQAFKKHNNHEQLLSKVRQSQETLAKSVRFEQIWRSRRGNKEASSDEAVHDVCHFYDIVCVDDEERPIKVQEHDELSLGDQRLLSSYLPLLREFIPSDAAEIESDPCLFSDQDDYVYDYYTVKDNMAMEVEYVSSPFPLVQVAMTALMMSQNVIALIQMLKNIHTMSTLMNYLKTKTTMKRRRKRKLWTQKQNLMMNWTRDTRHRDCSRPLCMKMGLMTLFAMRKIIMVMVNLIVSMVVTINAFEKNNF